MVLLGVLTLQVRRGMDARAETTARVSDETDFLKFLFPAVGLCICLLMLLKALPLFKASVQNQNPSISKSRA